MIRKPLAEFSKEIEWDLKNNHYSKRKKYSANEETKLTILN